MEVQKAQVTLLREYSQALEAQNRTYIRQRQALQKQIKRMSQLHYIKQPLQKSCSKCSQNLKRLATLEKQQAHYESTISLLKKNQPNRVQTENQTTNQQSKPSVICSSSLKFLKQKSPKLSSTSTQSIRAEKSSLESTLTCHKCSLLIEENKQIKVAKRGLQRQIFQLQDEVRKLKEKLNERQKSILDHQNQCLKADKTLSKEQNQIIITELKSLSSQLKSNTQAVMRSNDMLNERIQGIEKIVKNLEETPRQSLKFSVEDRKQSSRVNVEHTGEDQYKLIFKSIEDQLHEQRQQNSQIKAQNQLLQAKISEFQKRMKQISGVKKEKDQEISKKNQTKPRQCELNYNKETNFRSFTDIAPLISPKSSSIKPYCKQFGKKYQKHSLEQEKYETLRRKINLLKSQNEGLKKYLLEQS